MTRPFGRKAIAIVGAAAAALALAACTPPNEKPSDLKVDTATEFQAPTSESSTLVTTDNFGNVIEEPATDPEVSAVDEPASEITVTTTPAS
ncbi:hypothetical protein HCH15_06090 [Corynebacterium testudinoris]|uniref:Secreted protein n=1 Tax=Corynebacterium testudinoris TaxID=136857 RepID=A0A0G3H6D8_9CORY|nr:hypothetical protein [Corynebacterium testudinoris]AKK08310.1 hypothetical protein CTEST_04315 [Corynebacterium testudinoris]MBX8995751.1 hypothetical protein [Corynebacterium testudinoris]